MISWPSGVASLTRVAAIGPPFTLITTVGWPSDFCSAILLRTSRVTVSVADPGPAGFCGSLVVAEFASLAEAEAWLRADPYVAAGVFAHTQVRPFRQALP